MSDKRRLHLICNAHIDPVWLWEWQEGVAEALSTFRTAADLCEEYDGFVFNHNEAILYRWVAEYEPGLFERIKRLVAAGKWHVMGGWYLQPDCNMPCGESLVRQALVGKLYFKRAFGVEPRVAINFDPFGHTRGLVQILAKSGSDAYIFCRPGERDCPLPADDFVWVGYDGSTVTAHRSAVGYNSPLGKAREKIEALLDRGPGNGPDMVLWGVGDHGGGPSRRDLSDIRSLIDVRDEVEMRHSTPEAYFNDLADAGELPRYEGDLNPWAPGCYTSQIRIKRRHRALENEYYRAEKMASHASLSAGMRYPAEELGEALRDLLFSEFHDVLPGSSIEPAEEAALRLIDHGREIVSRVTTRAFFSLCSGQPRAAGGAYPILVYNPHPYPVTDLFACEFNLADQNWGESRTEFDVFQGDRAVPAQIEHELSNLSLDWRKRLVFRATLAPGRVTRFDATPRVLPGRRASRGAESALPDGVSLRVGRYLRFGGERAQLEIDRETGLIGRFCVDGATLIAGDGLRPIVMADYEDPWGSTVQRFRRLIGAFSLLGRTESSRFAGIDDRTVDPVRIVEHGVVRTVVEASFGYNDSRLLLTYRIPRSGRWFDVDVSVLWQEKNRMLKLAVPVAFAGARLHGQVAYGVESFAGNDRELVSQKWQCLSAAGDGPALLCIDDGVYGSDFAHDELRLSLLRSPAYSALSGLQGRDVIDRDRYLPRIDQGLRRFRFRFVGDASSGLLAAADRLALSFNERPVLLSFYPSGEGSAPAPFVELGEGPVCMTAFKRAEEGAEWVMRLFNPVGREERCRVSAPAFGDPFELRFGAFEIKTILLNDSATGKTAGWREADLLERPL